MYVSSSGRVGGRKVRTVVPVRSHKAGNQSSKIRHPVSFSSGTFWDSEIPSSVSSEASSGRRMDGARQRADRVVNRTGRKPGKNTGGDTNQSEREGRKDANIQSISPTMGESV
jgi:hypothetical protein